MKREGVSAAPGQGAGGGSDLSLLIGTRKVALEIPILEQGQPKTKGLTFSNCEEIVKTPAASYRYQ